MAENENITELEEWRDIPDWPGYRASSLGRIKGPRRFLKESIAPGGYLRVPLSDRPNGRRKMVFVHRLICQAFLGMCPRGKQVNHKNNLRHDNRADNLEYLTAKENCQYRRAHGTFPTGENNGRAKLTAEQAAEIRRRRASGEKLKALANEFHVHQNTIWWIASGQTWTE